jgi:hypothetical protein
MIIATRTLKYRRGGAVADVPVNIHAPERSVRGDWSCRYEIGWPEGVRAMEAAGIDSMQALVSALQMIGGEIYASSYHKAGALYVDEPGKGYGFPVAPGLRDSVVGDDRIYF